MSDRFFLDTNVFAYTFDQTAPVKRQRAQELVRHKKRKMSLRHKRLVVWRTNSIGCIASYACSFTFGLYESVRFTTSAYSFGLWFRL